MREPRRPPPMEFGLPIPDDLHTTEGVEAYLREYQKLLSKLDTPISGGPRRHHYIPQFFLKRFASKHGRMIRMSLPAEPPPSRRPTHVKNLAVMKDFYAVLTEKGDSAFLENLLSVWDSEASTLIKHATDASRWPLTDTDKLKLNFWFAMLHCRSPNFRRRYEAMADVVTQFAFNVRDDEDSVDPAEHRVLNHQNESITLMIESACKIMECLIVRRWLVIRFEEDGLVLTDDLPTLLPGQPHPVYGVGFGTSPEIILPLDRRTLLSLHMYGDMTDEFVTVASEPSRFLIRHYNNLLIASAYQEIFCHQSDYNHVLPMASRHYGRPLMGVGGPMTQNLRVDGVNTPPERRSPRRYGDYDDPRPTAETRQPNDSAEGPPAH